MFFVGRDTAVTATKILQASIDAALHGVAGPRASGHVEEGEEAGHAVLEQAPNRAELAMRIPPTT